VNAWVAVSDGLSVGWDRMVHVLFRGPGAGLKAWALWGLILLIAGAGGNLGSNWNVPAGEEDVPSLPDPSDIEPWMIALGVAVLVALVVVGFIWLYFRARFRFVMLEGVRTGVPRIRNVFATTRRAGGHYFLFELGLSLTVILLMAPLLLPWIPIIRGVFRGDAHPFEDALLLVVATVAWVVVLAIAAALVEWWVYDLVLPYVWLGRIDFRAGLERAWRLTRARLDAVLTLLLLRIVFGIAGVCAACLLGCASCVLWVWPALVVVAAVMASIAFPPLWILAIPLILVLAIAIAWIMATVTAPIPLFFRSWSWAVVHRLDPSVPLWDERLESGDGTVTS
jgi:hypothetical protein